MVQADHTPNKKGNKDPGAEWIIKKDNAREMQRWDLLGRNRVIIATMHGQRRSHGALSGVVQVSSVTTIVKQMTGPQHFPGASDRSGANAHKGSQNLSDAIFSVKVCRDLRLASLNEVTASGLPLRLSIRGTVNPSHTAVTLV